MCFMPEAGCMNGKPSVLQLVARDDCAATALVVPASVPAAAFDEARCRCPKRRHEGLHYRTIND